MRGEPRAPPPSSSPMAEGDTLISAAKKVFEGFDETLSGTVGGRVSRRCCGRLCVCPGVRVFLCGAVDEPLLCWGRPAGRAAAEDRKEKGSSSRRVFRAGRGEGTLLGRLCDQCLAAPCLAVAHAPAAWELCRGRACLTHVIAVFRISLFFSGWTLLPDRLVPSSSSRCGASSHSAGYPEGVFLSYSDQYFKFRRVG